MSRPNKLIKRLEKYAENGENVCLTSLDIARIVDYINEVEYARELSEEYAEKMSQMFCEKHYRF